MSNLTDKINVCKQCKHREFNPESGIVCGLTKNKPAFEDTCWHFSKAVEAAPVRAEGSFSRYYDTNDSAEKIVRIASIILLVLGCIFGVIAVLAGLYTYAEIEQETVLFSSLISGVLIVLSSIICWAFMNILVNISRNLANLNKRVENIDKKLHQ